MSAPSIPSRHVANIANRLRLRKPQRESLELLHRMCEIVPPDHKTDAATALAAMQLEMPGLKSFERDFPSLCFALATGVGKTRLMGAFIAYLFAAHGIRNFFVLAPNLTIYNKLKKDFEPNTEKYVLKGLAEFAVFQPEVITGDNYESRGALLSDLASVKINIFNISKITSEVRGGKQMRIRSFKEELGDSYFDYLAKQTDLVMLMDESHRYRATAGMRAINELKPVLGLELTATPIVEGPKVAVQFANVVYDYPLARAMEDGFVKDPAVVTRKDFSPIGKSPEVIQRMKLQDGISLHETVKVELETYARTNDEKIVKPFVLIIARDTTHAAELMMEIQSNAFFEGRYADKVIQVDSSVKEEETVEKLLTVESANNPVEIVIHVNMLKEGWDVTNLYTIIPLRAANARTLIEQSIGRGLRLPYGRRTGVEAVDRLNIVAHDRFQEIVDEANDPKSPIRLKTLVLNDGGPVNPQVTVVADNKLSGMLGIMRQQNDKAAVASGPRTAPVFTDPVEQRIAQAAATYINTLARKPELVPDIGHIRNADVQALVVEEMARQFQYEQLELDGIANPKPDFASVVAKTSALMVQQTINIPRISVMPKGEVKAGFRTFKLDLAGMNLHRIDSQIIAKFLDRNVVSEIGVSQGRLFEQRLEDYIVSGLIDFPDIAYDENADLLYDLSGQVVTHLRARPDLSEQDLHAILQDQQRVIANAVHAQMLNHYWEDNTVEYESVVKQGFSEIKTSAHTSDNEAPRDYRIAPADKSNMTRYLFGGFNKCLSEVVRFHSDSERRLVVILERETQKWFRPAKGQFQIFYRKGNDQREYVPDFVAETDDLVLMMEPKMVSQLDDPDVLAKRNAAIEWCKLASDYAASSGGKPWRYVLIPHDQIQDNMSIGGLVAKFGL